MSLEEVTRSNIYNFSNISSNIAPQSLFDVPIDRRMGRLKGYSREGSDASTYVKNKVKELILDNSLDFSAEDQALLLAIAEQESGFNPDAAALTTSAGGVFQLVAKTAENLGLSKRNIFDAELNIRAGVKLFKENVNFVDKKYPDLSKTKRAALLYALHHDGPSLRYGGLEIAVKYVLPRMQKYLR